MAGPSSRVGGAALIDGVDVDVPVLGGGGSLGGLSGHVGDACVAIVRDEVEVSAVGQVD